jgi:hypothetical protein
VLGAPLVLQMGNPQDENGLKTSSFYKERLKFEQTEIKDVLVVEDNVGHRETRRDFLLLFSKKFCTMFLAPCNLFVIQF